ncbi:MAG TPA: ABC transporter permease [Bryobacteraceae bacterium]|nr:ABC transporter permease [Bryobacteraceae bacterium]
MRIEHWLYALPLRFRSLFRRQNVERDLHDELQYHLERRREEFMAQGLAPEQARHAALRAMDGLTQRKEECRDTRGLNPLDNTIGDIRYSLRVLAKSPGFAAVAVLTLALAIGANAVVFSILNAFILKPMQVPQPETLFGIEHGREYSMYESYPDYADLRDRNRSFDALAAFTIVQAGFDAGANPARLWGDAVSGNYFDALRIQPYLGRFFHASDEHGANSAPYVVLSYRCWHTRFQDDRSIVGRRLELNKHPYVIIGVTPPDFHGILVFEAPEFFVPMVNGEQVDGDFSLTARNHQTVFMTLGHLKPGVAPEQAAADLNSIGSWLEKTYPNDHGQTRFKLVKPSLYGNYLGRPARAFLTGLMLLTGLILLGACANLGSLFAARATERSREVALRLALGATRGRVLRTLFTEAVLISMVGGAVGLWGSAMLLHALSAWRPFPQFPLNMTVNPDASVYAVALALALASGFLFGLVPVRQVLRVDPYQVVKAGPGERRGRRLTARDLLLATQIAICAVLVTSSLVALRGLERSLHSNFGFEPHNAMLVNTDLAMAGYHGDDVTAMQKRMMDNLRAIPGVESVGLVDWPPLSNGSAHGAMVFTDQTTDLKPANAAAEVYTYRISPDYLTAARTPLLAGRGFSSHDDRSAPRVAVVNQRFAGRVFGSPKRAIGAHFRLRNGDRVQVVGVVEDGKYISLAEDPRPAMFVPISQSPPTPETDMVLRSRRDPRQLAGEIRAVLHRLDPGLPAYIETWSQAQNIALFPSRVATVALGVLGIMGAMLSITGIFGMAASSVGRSLKELGIRLALGAQRREVLQAALGRAFRVLAFGSAAGLALGIMASRLLAHIVYQATPRDPLVLSGVVAAMALLGLAAVWIPAQRALSLDPLTLLRED